MTTRPITASYRAAARAFRDGRRYQGHATVSPSVLLGNLYYGSNMIAWKHQLTGVHGILFGRPHDTLHILNAVAELYGMGHPYRVEIEEDSSIFYFHNQEISTLQSQTIVGPIARLAVEVDCLSRAGL